MTLHLIIMNLIRKSQGNISVDGVSAESAAGSASIGVDATGGTLAAELMDWSSLSDSTIKVNNTLGMGVSIYSV